MKAINLTLSPVELDPINGPGMLAPATDDSDGLHERKLEKVTDREEALARAGTIALVDSRGRRRQPEDAPAPEGDEAQTSTGEGSA